MSSEHHRELPSPEEMEEAKHIWSELLENTEPRKDLLAQVEDAEAEPGGVAGKLKRMETLLAETSSGKKVKPVSELAPEDLKKEYQQLYRMRAALESSDSEAGFGMPREEFLQFSTMRIEELLKEYGRRKSSDVSPNISPEGM
ncbi:MAG: hypothetical protein Q7S09_04250 [bacterium]|nr:hypothetical protein [bacterium]